MRDGLEGRTALVTGGARGIGRAVCQRLGDAGANVVINYVSNQAAAEEAAQQVEAAGARAYLAQADVSCEQQVQEMVSQVRERFGPVDLLVNNAGVFDYVSHEETTVALWKRTLDVNLTGAFLVSWAVKREMIERRFGRIVNISSIGGLRARQMSIAYAASKAGLIGFTKSMAEAVARFNVRVNAVAPGLISTEILDGVAEEQLQDLITATPIQRIGEPAEIAELVVFLLSDRASFTTGQTVVASGGRVLLP
ncbi:MAG: 3-oxoacyl-ACP reductase family protein [Planctomycetota bacterium]|nr:3-oxoacyl-ACP reductase family protein [Planctomycetota bacterium]